MTTVHKRPPARPTRQSVLRLCGITAVVGVVLLLVPVLALRATHRTPDPLFLHAWWSPVASVPPETLTLGSIGLALLLAAGAAGALTVLLPHPVRRQAAVVTIGALLVVQLAGWLIAQHHFQHSTEVAVQRVLLDPAPAEVPGSSAQAISAIRLAASLPGTSSVGIRLRDRGSVPAGPLIVQKTEVLNQNADDEGADVEVGSLLDPLTGHLIAAWFWGL